MNEIVEEIISVLKANLPKNRVRYYFNGDPGEIASAHLPACIVMPSSSNYRPRWTGYDEVRYTITVILVDDARKYFNKPPEQVTGVKWLMETMEGTTNGQLNTDSILYLLRNKVTLNGKVTEGNIVSRPEYGFRPRGEVFGLEAQVVVEYLTRIQVNRE